MTSMDSEHLPMTLFNTTPQHPSMVNSLPSLEEYLHITEGLLKNRMLCSEELIEMLISDTHNDLKKVVQEDYRVSFRYFYFLWDQINKPRQHTEIRSNYIYMQPYSSCFSLF